MKKRKVLKTTMCILLATVFMDYNVASAASIRATLILNNQQVLTVFDSGTSGYHIVQVIGYEKSGAKYFFYDKTTNVTGGGTLETVHITDAGYKFVKIYNGVSLISSIRLVSSSIGSVVVN